MIPVAHQTRHTQNENEIEEDDGDEEIRKLVSKASTWLTHYARSVRKTNSVIPQNH